MSSTLAFVCLAMACLVQSTFSNPLGWSGAGNLGSYGGCGQGNIGVAGGLGVQGTTAVCGSVPVCGAVEYGGRVPAGGCVTIQGNCCGCGGTGLGGVGLGGGGFGGIGLGAGLGGVV